MRRRHLSIHGINLLLQFSGTRFAFRHRRLQAFLRGSSASFCCGLRRSRFGKLRLERREIFAEQLDEFGGREILRIVRRATIQTRRYDAFIVDKKRFLQRSKFS